MTLKVWICGAQGMLGSHFTRLLKERRIPFVATDRQQVDVTQFDPLSDFVRIQKITHIINCSAYTNVDQAENEPREAYLVNAIGPHHLGIAGRRHGARVIHFSTDYVFDGLKRLPYTEEDSCSPIGAYGMSKWAGETKLLEEHKKACVIRTSWLYGVSGKNFVATMLKLMSEREQLRVVADQVGRPTYCQDLAEITLDLLDAEGLFHFANEASAFGISWYELATEIHRQAKELGLPLKVQTIEPIRTQDYPTLAKRPAYSTLNTRKFELATGKMPRPWQQALTDYLQAYQSYQTVKQTS